MNLYLNTDTSNLNIFQLINSINSINSIMGNEFSLIPTSTSNSNLKSGKLYLCSRYVLNNYKNDETGIQIDHIITLFNLSTKIQDETIKHDIYDINDSTNPIEVAKLENILDTIIDSIHHSLSNGKNVCVHCAAGVSRSPTVVAAYLLKYNSINLIPELVDDPNNVLQYIIKHRSIIRPNKAFVELLNKKFGLQIRTIVSFDLSLQN